MAGRHRSDNEHNPSADKTKRATRIETGESNEHPIHSSRQAAHDAHSPNVGEKREPEVDAMSEQASLGIAESAARDRGESVPTTPYSRGQA